MYFLCAHDQRHPTPIDAHRYYAFLGHAVCRRCPRSVPRKNLAASILSADGGMSCSYREALDSLF